MKTSVKILTAAGIVMTSILPMLTAWIRDVNPCGQSSATTPHANKARIVRKLRTLHSVFFCCPNTHTLRIVLGESVGLQAIKKKMTLKD
ncbi:hypothetical protein [Roseovarius sp. EL26]|uniref:hypothetical protein n=1 Tax=Roseovarius sp. EL26 TaxID=2126672 RepID=UPI0013C4E824|nr:hypothetical protein [Roseovarius sp. EL26]